MGKKRVIVKPLLVQLRIYMKKKNSFYVHIFFFYTDSTHLLRLAKSGAQRNPYGTTQR